MILWLVGIAVMTWGLSALGLIALGFVPVMFGLIILITLGLRRPRDPLTLAGPGPTA